MNNHSILEGIDELCNYGIITLLDDYTGLYFINLLTSSIIVVYSYV